MMPRSRACSRLRPPGRLEPKPGCPQDHHLQDDKIAYPALPAVRATKSIA